MPEPHALTASAASSDARDDQASLGAPVPTVPCTPSDLAETSPCVCSPRRTRRSTLEPIAERLSCHRGAVAARERCGAPTGRLLCWARRERTRGNGVDAPGPFRAARVLRPTHRRSDATRRAARRRASAVERARRMVPEGTFAVGAGLAISGITTYGFQILAFRGLSKPDYAALNALWVFVFVLAPGVFLPLEQEVGRAVVGPARARRRRRPGDPARRLARRRVLARARARRSSCSTLTTEVVQNKFNDHVGLVVCLDRRAVHVRDRVPRARRVRGRRPLRRVRLEPRRRRRHPAAAVHPARDRGRDQPGLVRPVPRDPAAARDRRSRCTGRRASRCPGRPRRGRSCRATSGTCSADRCSRRC